jgi:DNA polymerase-3 subunit delta'
MAKEKTISIPLPRENHLLFGHAAAQAQFVQEAERGLLHHAYLMSGPKGIGKATLAYRFARYILSRGAVSRAPVAADSFSLFDEPALPQSPIPNPQSLDMSPESPLFRRIAGGTHTDLLTIAPAYDAKKQVEKDSISVDDARKVPEFLSLTPAEGDWRVVIVDAVDQLNANAANALLKILEEPPARAILFLICHKPGGILPTIRSRCRNFALTAPSKAEFEQTLGSIAPSIMLHEVDGLYALSNGSPGYAITLHASDGISIYRQWLEALQPTATAEQRNKFASFCAAQKSPEIWRSILHGWNTAITRINLWPHVGADQWILDGEGGMLAAIAESLSPRQREQWHAQASQLLTTTDVFNLDKRQTMNMLLAPQLLAMIA